VQQIVAVVMVTVSFSRWRNVYEACRVADAATNSAWHQSLPGNRVTVHLSAAWRMTSRTRREDVTFLPTESCALPVDAHSPTRTLASGPKRLHSKYNIILYYMHADTQSSLLYHIKTRQLTTSADQLRTYKIDEVWNTQEVYTTLITQKLHNCTYYYGLPAGLFFNHGPTFRLFAP